MIGRIQCFNGFTVALVRGSVCIYWYDFVWRFAIVFQKDNFILSGKQYAVSQVKTNAICVRCDLDQAHKIWLWNLSKVSHMQKHQYLSSLHFQFKFSVQLIWNQIVTSKHYRKTLSRSRPYNKPTVPMSKHLVTVERKNRKEPTAEPD